LALVTPARFDSGGHSGHIGLRASFVEKAPGGGHRLKIYFCGRNTQFPRGPAQNRVASSTHFTAHRVGYGCGKALYKPSYFLFQPVISDLDGCGASHRHLPLARRVCQALKTKHFQWDQLKLALDGFRILPP